MIMQHDPEFILVIGRGSAMINACRQIRERDPEIIIFSNNTMDNERVWEALGDNANNILFPRPFVDLMSDRYVLANNKFTTSHGHEMNWLNIYGFSIANYLARGLKWSNGEKELMRDYLTTLDVESIRGNLKMAENHDVLVPNVIFRRSGGKNNCVWVPVD